MMSDDDDEKISTIQTPSESDKILINPLRTNSPSDFLASFGKLEDFSKFGEYLTRLNKKCCEKWASRSKMSGDGAELKIGDRIMVRNPSYDVPGGGSDGGGGDLNGSESDDIEWRRGLVQSIDRKQYRASAYLVDEGYVWDKQPFECMIRLSDLGDDIVWMDPVAKLCRLRNAYPSSACWTRDAIDYFWDLINGGDVFVTAYSQLPNDTHHVFEFIYDVDISIKGESLLNSMISAGYAIMNRPKFIEESARNNESQRVEKRLNGEEAQSSKASDQVVKHSSKQSQSHSVFDENAQDDDDIYDLTGANNEESDDEEDAYKVVYIKDMSMDKKKLTSNPKPMNRSSIVNNNNKNTNNHLSKSANNDDKIYENGPANNRNRDNNSVLMSSATSCCSMTSQTAVMKERPTNQPAAVAATANNQTNRRNHNSQLNEVINIDDDDDLPSEVYISRIDPKDKRPILKPVSFIASDETILTGYRPNVLIDHKKIAEEIRITRMEKYNLKVVSSDPTPSSISPITQEKSIATEKKVYEILTGSSGFYDTNSSKIKALAGLYRTKPSRHVENLIIKCVLREVKKDNLDYKVAFEILNGLDFCDDSAFLRALKEIVDEQSDLNNDPDQAHLDDEARQDVCRLLANLYLFANESPRIKFLAQIPKYCVNLIEDWIGIYINRDIPNHVYLANFKNVHDFLDVCAYAFKKYSKRAMNYVYRKVDGYSQDNTLNHAIKSEGTRILSLLASKFLDDDPHDEARTTSKSAGNSPMHSSSLESTSSMSVVEKPRPRAHNNPRHFNYYSRTYCSADMDLAFSKFLEQTQRGDNQHREAIKRRNNN